MTKIYVQIAFAGGAYLIAPVMRQLRMLKCRFHDDNFLHPPARDCSDGRINFDLKHNCLCKIEAWILHISCGFKRLLRKSPCPVFVGVILGVILA